jgi:hypothetical protein
MAAYNKFNDFVEQLLRAKHDFGSHVFKAVLTNVAPAAGNAVLADLTQIANGGGYVAGGYVLDSVVLTEVAGVSKVVIADEVITASGGSIGPFRYVAVYNATSAGGPLVCSYDYGSSITLLDTESFTLDFDGAAGVFTLA